jgi:hypothetical protein
MNISTAIEIYERRLSKLDPNSQAYKWGLHQLKQFKLQVKKVKK